MPKDIVRATSYKHGNQKQEVTEIIADNHKINPVLFGMERMFYQKQVGKENTLNLLLFCNSGDNELLQVPIHCRNIRK